MMDKNIIEIFFDTAARLAKQSAFTFKTEKGWRSMSWEELAETASKLANGLEQIGIKKGDRVAICSPTTPQWSLADLAILMCQAVSVPIYPTLPLERINYILRDANVEAVFIENPKMGALQCSNIIQMGASENRLSIKGLIEQSDPVSKLRYETTADKIKMEDIATIIYTSGTTGTPKGVVITHENIAAEVRAAKNIFSFKPDDICFVCLPLAHVLGRLIQFYQLAQGCSAAYLESPDKFAQNCRDIRPHFMAGVPRMLEKMHERLMIEMSALPSWRRFLFDKAISTGGRARTLLQKHRPIPILLRVEWAVADFFVLRKIRMRLGGRLRLFISGGAPLSAELARFFDAIGLLTLEGYGLTETFAAVTVNRPDDYHFGTVGKPVDGVELKLSPDGEIMVRGPTVFKEYLNLPLETSSAKTQDGWFFTGDIGEYSRDGFLRIIDRKKDLIVTAGGENISPQMIENMLMESPYVGNCMVYGDRKKFISAIITLNRDLINTDKVHELIGGVVAAVNEKLARHEMIKKFAILDRDFSIETGELTPTFKVRRKFTTEKYKQILEGLYS